jgi:hypothetical protein
LEALERFRRGVCGIGDIGGPYGPYASKGQQYKRQRTYCWRANRFKDVNALKGLLFQLLSARRQRQIIDAHALASTPRVSRWTDAASKEMVFRARRERS